MRQDLCVLAEISGEMHIRVDNLLATNDRQSGEAIARSELAAPVAADSIGAACQSTHVSNKLRSVPKVPHALQKRDSGERLREQSKARTLDVDHGGVARRVTRRARAGGGVGAPVEPINGNAT